MFCWERCCRLWFCWPAMLFGRTELAPVSRTYAITNVNIVQAPGGKIDMGTVVMKERRSDRFRWEKCFHPRWCDCHQSRQHVCICRVHRWPFACRAKQTRWRARPKTRKIRVIETGRGWHYTPKMMFAYHLIPAKVNRRTSRTGFPAAHVVPYGGMMPGNGSIILLAVNRPMKWYSLTNLLFIPSCHPHAVFIRERWWA